MRTFGSKPRPVKQPKRKQNLIQIDRAYAFGVRLGDCVGELQQWMQQTLIRHRAMGSNDIRVYNNTAYLFKDTVLLLRIMLPKRLRKQCSEILALRVGATTSIESVFQIESNAREPHSSNHGHDNAYAKSQPNEELDLDEENYNLDD